MNDEYISVKEFAESVGVSQTYIYKILNTKLKPYSKKINKKKYIQVSAVNLLKNGTLDGVQLIQQIEQTAVQPSEQADLRPINSTFQSTNSTSNLQLDVEEKQQQKQESGEIEALKQLISELKTEKEELKKDKEYLKNECNKWQALYIDEHNQVKLLQAAAAEPIEPDQQEENKSFFKRLFRK